MKQLVLVALIAALASSAMTLLLEGAFRPPAAAPPSAVSAADFKAALADLEREVAALRREAAERAGAAPASTAGQPWPGRVAGGPPSPDPGAPGAVRPPSEPAAAEPSAAHLQRFRELFSQDEEGNTSIRRDARARWLFRGEREVLDWFGLPENISIDDGSSETWYYEIPTGAKDEEGNPDTKAYRIRLNRGRLIEIDE